MNQRISIALGLMELEVSQKALCAAGMLDGVWEEGESRQELIVCQSQG